MHSLNSNPSGPHHHLVYEFYHGPTKNITPMFFGCFWALPKIQTMASKIHILTLDGPTATNEA